MKKKIFIFSHAMEIGGAERALLGLLDSFDYSKYDIDLFLMRHSGELMSLIPNNVNILPLNRKYSSLAIPIVSVIKNGNFDIAAGRFIGKLKAQYFNKKMGYSDSGTELEYSHKYTERYMPMMSDKEYDLAISFLTPHYYVANKVNANKKIAWIHTDYSFIDIDVESELKMWSVYDNVISISDDVTKVFLTKFPSLENRIKLIENILSKSNIKSQSELFNAKGELNGSINLLSIG
ncbi:MAG: glycosyltransferase, partial [Eubacterium sp.]|nr:glycosyltransferase [Eubacterium sp.]